jgi:hypothetical protein
MEEMKGCYLLRVEQPPDDDGDWPNFPDRVQQVFVYATDDELIEFMTNDDETIKNNVRYNDKGKKVFDVECYNKIDVGRTVFSDKAKRSAEYSDVRYLFDGEEFHQLFDKNADIHKIYMQCQLAQHCRWHQEQTVDYMYAECMKAMLEFHANGDQYPGYDPDFEMPTPEQIEQLKKKLGITSEN